MAIKLRRHPYRWHICVYQKGASGSVILPYLMLTWGRRWIRPRIAR